MRLSKFIQGISLVTVIALVYIHLQMQIYDLAYKGKGKEDCIRQLSESNATTAYHILELKSVNYLGDRLLAQDQQLRFRDNQNTVQLVTSDVIFGEEGPAAMVPQPRQDNSFLNLLTVKAEARTRPEDERNLFRIMGEDR